MNEINQRIWEAHVGLTIPVVIDHHASFGFLFVNPAVPIFGPDGSKVRKLVDTSPNGSRKYESDRLGKFKIKKWVDEEGENPEGNFLGLVNKDEFENLKEGSPNKKIKSTTSRLRKILKNVEKEVKDRAEKKAEEKIKNIKDTYAKKFEVLDKKEKGLEEHEDRLGKRESRLEDLEKREKKFEEKGGPEFMEILQAVTDESKGPAPELEAGSLKGGFFHRTDFQDVDVFDHLLQKLETNGYEVDDPLSVVQFVLSTIVAAATGQFVVLSGPTGVGKTSLIRKMSDLLGSGPLDHNRGIVPVRPAWIDSSDLLGFFNPSEKKFKPEPFLDEIKNAERYSKVDGLYFLVLDEMNLSRIENYGADLLARMEKSRGSDMEQKTGLPLYSKEQAERRREKIHALVERIQLGEVSDGEKRKLESKIAEMKKQNDRYPPRLEIPNGLVLFGTLNADQTTHNLSPKLKDRAFIIQLPPADLSSDLGSSTDTQDLQTMCTLTQKFVNGIDPNHGYKQFGKEMNTKSSAKLEASDAWKDIIVWNRKYLYPMGVNLSRRFKMLFRYYLSTASAVGLPSNKISAGEVVSTFLLSKVMPRISFHRDDAARGRLGEGKKPYTLKKEALADWRSDLADYEDKEHSMNYTPLKEAVESILQDGDLTYEYMSS